MFRRRLLATTAVTALAGPPLDGLDVSAITKFGSGANSVSVHTDHQPVIGFPHDLHDRGLQRPEAQP